MSSPLCRGLHIMEVSAVKRGSTCTTLQIPLSSVAPLYSTFIKNIEVVLSKWLFHSHSSTVFLVSFARRFEIFFIWFSHITLWYLIVRLWAGDFCGVIVDEGASPCNVVWYFVNSLNQAQLVIETSNHNSMLNMCVSLFLARRPVYPIRPTRRPRLPARGKRT